MECKKKNNNGIGIKVEATLFLMIRFADAILLIAEEDDLQSAFIDIKIDIKLI